MSQSTKNAYKDSVNLPKTEFPIRAGLAEKEPELLKKWTSDSFEHTYEKFHAAKDTDKIFTLHDGPPYPNGNIHMGHALNKVLKDIANRYWSINGYRVNFTPGWDCHGLPIETQVIKELKANNEEEKRQDIPWFRNRCKEFALAYVESQKKEFVRLGISANWEKPYLTLNPEYEAATLEAFGKLADNGLVYKGRKPIHWCMSCETALAEAEIEYAEHRSPSVFVTFKVVYPTDTLHAIIGDTENANVLVWTTTPWTLPSNVAVAVHPDFEYTILQHKEELLLCVSELKDTLIESLGLEEVTERGTIAGRDLLGTEIKHPFLNRTVKIVSANYVTKEDGTGFVHIAPGHGQDDYFVGLEHDLPILMPVDSKGNFTEEVEWAGMNVFDANKEIGLRMESKGTLRKLKFIKHAYPHCWRCKNPVIFRATEQWFVGMDLTVQSSEETLRSKALAAIDTVTWFPEWGEKRIRPMIENRPDWCISRQRYWGIPIPVFKCRSCGHAEMTGVFNSSVIDLVRKEGTMAWFNRDVKEILPENALCSNCGSADFEKESDILDVWFESGASFASVIKDKKETNYPADLYLEGSDQHRGWFQSALLISMGSEGKAPFKSVLTHGFIVDSKGKKMSKSTGNVISPQEVIKEYGADILRWWIASVDFKNDISVSKEVLNQSRDSFSKVRNTIRFCLSNLDDFNSKKDIVEHANLCDVDQWALMKLNELLETVHVHYKNFDFHVVTNRIHDFCAVTMSNLYLDIVKDRLYCDGKDSQTRKSTQTAIFHIVNTLITLVSPILVFTSEDAFSYFDIPEKEDSVHFKAMATSKQDWVSTHLKDKFKAALAIREQVYQQLEVLRKNKEIGSFLEAEVNLKLDKDIKIDDWESFLIVSRVTIEPTTDNTEITVKKASGEKCQRCWKILPIQNELCKRCEGAIN